MELEVALNIPAQVPLDGEFLPDEMHPDELMGSIDKAGVDGHIALDLALAPVSQQDTFSCGNSSSRRVRFLVLQSI